MSHWTTSGKLRLKEQQKRSFRMRAHYSQSKKRFRTHASDQFIQYDHPVLRKRPAVDGIRMSLANPIARRGIVVAAENPQRYQQTHSAPHAANLGGRSHEKRGIRNLERPRPNNSAPARDVNRTQTFQTFNCQPQYRTVGSCCVMETNCMRSMPPFSSIPPPTAVSREHGSIGESARSSLYDSLAVELYPEKHHFLPPRHPMNPSSSDITYGSSHELSRVTPQSSKQRVPIALPLADDNLWYDLGQDSSWDKGDYAKHHDLSLSREVRDQNFEASDSWLDHMQETNTSNHPEQYSHNRHNGYPIHRNFLCSDLVYDGAQLSTGNMFQRQLGAAQAREPATADFSTQNDCIFNKKPLLASTKLTELRQSASLRQAAVTSPQVEQMVDEKAHDALLTFLDADDDSHTAPGLFQRVNQGDHLSASQLHSSYDNPGLGNNGAHNTNIESSKGFSRFKKLQGAQSTILKPAHKEERQCKSEESNRLPSFGSSPETPSRLRFFINGVEVDIGGTPLSTPLSPGWMHS